MQEETTVFCIKEGRMIAVRNPTKTHVMTQVMKCHVLQVYVVVKHFENLDVGWCVFVCVRVCGGVCVWCVCGVCGVCECVCVCGACVWCGVCGVCVCVCGVACVVYMCVCVWCVCVCVCVCGVPRCTADSLPGVFVSFSCLCLIRLKQGLREAIDTFP